MLPTAEEPVAAAPCAEAWETPEAKLEAPTKQARRRPTHYSKRKGALHVSALQTAGVWACCASARRPSTSPPHSPAGPSGVHDEGCLSPECQQGPPWAHLWKLGSCEP